MSATIKLNNGHQIPVVGLGTWKSAPNAVKEAVVDAVKAGYRHIDCAFAYDNEHEVGAALQELFAAGVVKREDLFITSKLWNTFHSKDRVPKAIAKTLADLKLTYIDLYLIHWPVAYKEIDEFSPTDENGQVIMSKTDYVETWKAFEELVKQGLTRSIGISNFNVEQTKRVLNVAKIKPVVNQIECHPYLAQKELSAFCKNHDIVVTAYSPLGSPDRMWAKPDDPLVLNDPAVKAIADAHSKSVAQVCIRYQIQRGHVVIPKSVTKSRIVENLDVFDFVLSGPEMDTLNGLDRNYRAVVAEWMKPSPFYPF